MSKHNGGGTFRKKIICIAESIYVGKRMGIAALYT